MGLPILPIESLDQYVKTNTFGMIPNAYELTGTFHDQFGWEELVAQTAVVFTDLPTEEQEECVILASNFSIAGAIDLFGPEYRLPQVICADVTYYLWGPGEKSGKFALAVGIPKDDLELLYDEVQLAYTVKCQQCSPHYQSVPIYVCRKPRGTLQEIWHNLRREAFG